MKIKQAINIAKGCVMASFMDSETKQMVIKALNQVAVPKTETTSCEWCKKPNATMAGSIGTVDMSKANYCPNCGRRLEETT